MIKEQVTELAALSECIELLMFTKSGCVTPWWHKQKQKHLVFQLSLWGSSSVVTSVVLFITQNMQNMQNMDGELFFCILFCISSIRLHILQMAICKKCRIWR
jgi:hypothetical protein